MIRKRQAIRIFFLCYFILASLALAAAAVEQNNDGAADSFPRKKVVLAFGAANSWVKWSTIETFSKGRWSINYINLKGFGDTMRQNGSFQAALDQFDNEIRSAITTLQPDVLLVASKGLGIVTYLASKKIYTGAVVMLSPIPNECNHVHGETWDEQWTSSMNVLVHNNVGPIGIGVGTSTDEQDLIVDLMNETQVCGNLVTPPGRRGTTTIEGRMLFEKCPNFFLHSFPGNHGWMKKHSNAAGVAYLIEGVIRLQQNQIVKVPTATTTNEEL